MDERFYHDPQRKIMIWVAANEDDRTEADIALEKQQREDNGYIYRIVGSQDDLQEKLTLFDEELDDRIMEALKAVYTTQAQEQMSDLEIKDARIFKKDDKFCLQITGSRPLVAEIPMEQYESLKERAADLLDSQNPPDLGTEKNLLVTPKDIDSQVKDLSKVIGYGINLALQPGLTLEDLDLLLS